MALMCVCDTSTGAACVINMCHQNGRTKVLNLLLDTHLYAKKIILTAKKYCRRVSTPGPSACGASACQIIDTEGSSLMCPFMCYPSLQKCEIIAGGLTIILLYNTINTKKKGFQKTTTTTTTTHTHTHTH